MNNTESMNALDEIIFAKRLGREGAYNGKQAPCQDKQLMVLFEGIQVGSPHGMNLLTAWNESRHAELENIEEDKQMLIDVFGEEQS